jgi:hypothetical protein
MTELRTAISRGIGCLIYVTSGLTELQITSLGLPSSAIVVDDENNFEISLKQNLERLMYECDVGKAKI